MGSEKVIKIKQHDALFSCKMAHVVYYNRCKEGEN